MKGLLDEASKYCNTYKIVGRAHYLAADRKQALNHLFGVPVIVITAIIGTTIFGTLNKSPDQFWRIIAGLTSLAGTVLSSLQTSLGFAQDAEKHKTAGEAYRAVSRKFEMFLLKYAQAAPEQWQAAFSDLNELVSSLDSLPKKFPTLPDHFYDKAKKEYKGTQQDAQAGGPTSGTIVT